MGDFNHDGVLDIATATDCFNTQDCSGASIQILLGNSKGSFTQQYYSKIDGFVEQANTLAVGDFNGDGRLDLMVGSGLSGANYGTGELSIFRGDGTGKLLAPVTYQTVGYGAVTPVVADFNGDKRLDVAATAWTDDPTGANTSLTILIGKGNGFFNAPVITNVPYPTLDLVAADFNGDGKQDLALATAYGSVQVLSGEGNGKFRTPVAYEFGQDQAYETTIAVADLNGDHKPDLVFGGEGADSYGSLLNDGKGGFLLGPSYPLGGWNAASIVSADFNGDGDADILLATYCSETGYLADHCPDGTLGVMLGNGDGTMQAVATPDPAASLHYSVVADMNNDGIPDIVGTQDCYLNNCGNQEGGIVVSLGKGGGAYASPLTFPAVVQRPSGLAIGDLRGDGRLDVIVNGYSQNSTQLAVLLGYGNGSLEAAKTYALNSQSAIGPPVVGNFVGNGRLGVATVYQYQSGTVFEEGVAVLLGKGNGILDPEVDTPTTEIDPFGLTAGDFNGDGKTDVAVMGYEQAFSPDAGVTVLLGKGNGAFTVKADPDHNPGYNYFCDAAPCTFPASYPTFGEMGQYPPHPASITTADLNGDGILDLIIANECRLYDSSCSTGEMVYFHGNGDGTFNDFENNAPQYQLADANYLSVAVQDVNNDGKPDIVATTGSGIAVYLAPFTAPGVVYATSAHEDAEIPFIADLNGDGAPDIAVSNSSTVEVLYNRYPPTP